MRRHGLLTSIALVLVLSAISLPAQEQSTHYHVVGDVTIGKGEQADFLSVDPVHHRLYGAGNAVVDLTSDHVVHGAPGGAAGGYAIAPDLNRGLARNGVLFDLSTLAVVGKVAGHGDASVYDPVTHRAFLIDDTTTVVDLTTDQVVGTVSIGHGLESAVADGQGKIFINEEHTATLIRLDARSLAVEARYPIGDCGNAKALAMDRGTRRLFVGCRFAFVALNADDGTVVGRIPVAGQADANAFDSSTKLVFSPNGGGKGVVIIHEDAPDRYSILDTVMVENEGSAALDDVTHKLYLRYGHLPKPIKIPYADVTSPEAVAFVSRAMRQMRLMIAVLAP